MSYNGADDAKINSYRPPNNNHDRYVYDRDFNQARQDMSTRDMLERMDNLHKSNQPQTPYQYTPRLNLIILLVIISVIVGYKYDSELGWIVFLSPIIVGGILRWYIKKPKSKTEKRVLIYIGLAAVLIIIGVVIYLSQSQFIKSI